MSAPLSLDRNNIGGLGVMLGQHARCFAALGPEVMKRHADSDRLWRLKSNMDVGTPYLDDGHTLHEQRHPKVPFFGELNPSLSFRQTRVGNTVLTTVLGS